MSIDKYFDKFPVITYANNQAVDITKRVALLDKVSRNPYIFYPYDIVSDERADQLSSRYYLDSYKSWILYLSNKITDPYYEWYLTESELLEFLEKKYGSVYNSRRKIKFYRNDWESQETLDSSGFNALIPELKKYWVPNYYDDNPKVLFYSRNQIDWTVTTNKVMAYTVNNSQFILDEVVDITLDGLNFGQGQVVSTVGNQLYVQHVSGFFEESETVLLDLDNNNSQILGSESNTTATITAVRKASTNISDEEAVYWKAVTYYDYEYEKNEFNRSIRIIDKDQAEVAVKNLTELLGG